MGTVAIADQMAEDIRLFRKYEKMSAQELMALAERQEKALEQIQELLEATEQGRSTQTYHIARAALTTSSLSFRGARMTYDHWKTTNSFDELLGPPPEIEVTCGMCCGEGYVANGAFHYYPGHGEEVLCENCGGNGFFLCEAEGTSVQQR